MPKIIPRKTMLRVFDHIPVFDPSKPMNAEEVAEFLGFSTDYVYRLVRRKQLPAVKIGNRLFFNPRTVYEIAGMDDYLPREFKVQ